MSIVDKQKKGLKRNTIDKYYTKESIVDLCLEKCKEYIHFGDDLIIEPSAGNGAFIKGIQSITKNYKFYDIEPAHSEIIKQDYLQLDLNKLKYKIHIIGNPPFGRQCSTAIQFIKKSVCHCDSISFILPKSFKKESLQKTFPLCFHLVFEIDLPENAFLVNGLEHNVPCVFQIWQKKETERKVNEKVIPNHFTFVKEDADPDISFRRVGVNAGKIEKDTNKSIQSHYFIKFTNIFTDKNKNIEDCMKKLSTITFENNNTVGPKSISKQELIKEFNKVL